MQDLSFTTQPSFPFFLAKVPLNFISKATAFPFYHAIWVEWAPPLLHGLSLSCSSQWAHKTIGVNVCWSFWGTVASLYFCNSYWVFPWKVRDDSVRSGTATPILQMWGAEPRPAKGLPCEWRQSRETEENRVSLTSFKPLCQAAPETGPTRIFSRITQNISLNWSEWQQSRSP